MTPKQLHTLLQSLLTSPLLITEQEPSNRCDLYFLYRWLFQEVLLNLSLLRNSELVKYLNYLILKKHPQLLAYVKNKLKLQKRVKLTPE